MINDKFTEKLIRFILMTLEGSECSDDLLILLKEKALRMYDRGLLNESDHCDIEAFLDYKLEEMRK